MKNLLSKRFRLSATIVAIELAILATVGYSGFSAANAKPIAQQPISAERNSVGIAPAAQDSFQVVGTEPFWGFAINAKGNAKSIVYTSADGPRQTFPYVTPLAAQGRPADLVRVYPLKRGTTTGTLVIRRGTCSDGMSDQKYGYNATLILGNIVREGCALKK